MGGIVCVSATNVLQHSDSKFAPGGESYAIYHFLVFPEYRPIPAVSLYIKRADASFCDNTAAAFLREILRPCGGKCSPAWVDL